MLTSKFLKLRRRDELSEAEKQALEAAVSEVRVLPARSLFIRANVPLKTSTLLLDGLICRHADTPEGNRQILALHVPGDFLDLHSFLLKSLEHDVSTITESRVAIVPHTAIRQITETQPHLGRMLWFSTLLDAAIHREWIASVGRRSAIARVAHLFCELYTRLEVVGLAKDQRFLLPLTQTDLGDACGLTSVHVNRTLRELRERGLLEYRNGEVFILDPDGLCSVGDFDPAYLYLDTNAL